MTSEPIVRGPYKNGIKRRRDIVESAARVFGRFGYAGGSLRQIADEVGVTPAALTRHFGSKEGLLEAVLAYWDTEADRQLPASLRGLDYYLSLPASLVDHMRDRGLVELFLTMSAEASNPNHPARDFIRERYARVVLQGVAYLREARSAGQILPMDDDLIESEARGVFALMDGVQLQWLLDPTMELVAVFGQSLGHILTRWTGVEHSWSRAGSNWTIGVPQPLRG
jgi:AcrR family transcriptional regulator